MEILRRFYSTVRPPIAFKLKVANQRAASQAKVMKKDISQRETYNNTPDHRWNKKFHVRDSSMHNNEFLQHPKKNFHEEDRSQDIHQERTFQDINQERTSQDIHQERTSFSNEFVSSDLFSVSESMPRKRKVSGMPKPRKFSSDVTESKSIKGPNISINNEIVYGIYPVLLALQTQKRSFYNLYFKDASLQKNNKLQEIYELCQSYEVPSHSVNKNEFNRLVGLEKVHQGVCLEASKLPFLIYEKLSEEEKLDFQVDDTKKLKLWLYLDQINDPMNLGALLRTAYYLGVDKVFTSQTDSCPISNVVSKASAGAAEIFPIYQILEVDQFLHSLEEKNWHIMSSVTHSNNSTSVNEFKSSKNIFLIVGNEGRGVSMNLRESSDILITIPPNERCIDDLQSLNVSAATSIILHGLVSKLNQST